MTEKYIGLMSGTSLDAIDVALVDFARNTPILLATHQVNLPHSMRKELAAFHQPSFDEINRLGKLDYLLGKQFANATLQLLAQEKLNSHNIRAIGNHGQTIRHQPQAHYPFTLQIGDPNIITRETGITTVADFRRRDMAAGGQGAPLTPAFHDFLFRDPQKNRIIVNIGGIANVTLLLCNQPIIGYDTGPGNALLNAWCEKHLKQPFDKNGEWAASGQTNSALLNALLADPYFQKKYPKSTGREHFHLAWLEKHLSHEINPQDVQATLVTLTAQSILKAIKQHVLQGEILVCGGGVHNIALMTTLQKQAQGFSVKSTEAYNIHPDWIEAMAFAWFAKQTLSKKTSNLPSVTGALAPVILGGVYYPTTT